MIRKALVVGCTAVGLLVLTPPPAIAAPSNAGCIGQFFSEHAGLVPDSGGQESVGGFIAPTARELRSDFGAAISSAARSSDRSDCGL